MSTLTSAKADAFSGDSYWGESAFLKCSAKQEMKQNIMSAVYTCQHLDKYQLKLGSINWRPTFLSFLFPKTGGNRAESMKSFFLLRVGLAAWVSSG